INPPSRKRRRGGPPAHFPHHIWTKKPPPRGERPPRPPAARPPLAPTLDRPQPHARPAPAAAAAPLVKRPFGLTAPRALVIGSSTGGPQALMSLVTDIGPVIDRFPVLITQHMPPTFTTILAEHLARSSHRPAHEAVDGAIVKPGRICLAPGGRHMKGARHGADTFIVL